MYAQQFSSNLAHGISPFNNSSITAGFPIQPDVKLKKLAFYDTLGTLLQPSTLVPSSTARQQEGTYYFHLTPQQATDIAMNRDLRNQSKPEYLIQVQLRFCLLETTCEQEDYFPPNVQLKVNGKMCQLPVSWEKWKCSRLITISVSSFRIPSLPTSQVLSQSDHLVPSTSQCMWRSRPQWLTVRKRFVWKLCSFILWLRKTSRESWRNFCYTKNSRIVYFSTVIHVQWQTEFNRGFVISCYLVRKLTSDCLLQRMKSKGAKPAEFTRGLSKWRIFYRTFESVHNNS